MYVKQESIAHNLQVLAAICVAEVSVGRLLAPAMALDSGSTEAKQLKAQGLKG